MERSIFFSSYRAIILLVIWAVLCHGPLFADGGQSAVSSTNSLLNPGFEDTAGGFPTGWRRHWKPIYHVYPDLAHSGSGCVCVSRRNYFYQDVSCIPGIGYALLSHMRGTVGGETAVATEWFTAEEEYRLVANSFPVTDEQTTIRIEPKTLRDYQWVYFDDLTLLSEFVEDGGFEDEATSWQLSAGAVRVVDAVWSHSGQAYLSLTSSATAAQQVAVEVGDKVYSFTGVHRGNSASIQIAWFGRSGERLREDSFPIASSADWVSFKILLASIPGRGLPLYEIFDNEPVFAEIRLVSTGPGCGFDDVHLLWSVAVPRCVSPDGDGHRDSTAFTFALDRQTEYEILICNSVGEAILSSASNPGRIGSNTFEWDGRDGSGMLVTEGTYTLQAGVPLEGGLECILEATTEVRAADPVAPATADFSGFFPRGIWLSTTNFVAVDPDRQEQIVQELADAGFDTLYAQDPGVTEDVVPIFEAARRHGMRLIFGPGFFFHFYFGLHGYEDVTPERVDAEILRFWERVPDREGLIAYQVLDEPGPALVPLLQTYGRALSARDPGIPPVTVVFRSDDQNGIIAALNSPVFINDIYANRRENLLGQFPAFTSRLNTARQTADSYGVPFWVMLSSFSVVTLERNQTAAETRAMVYLSIAAGCRGVFFFLSGEAVISNGRMITGIVTPAGKIANPVYREMNILLAELEPLLLDWEPSDLSVQVAAPHTASPFRDSSGTDYVVVVNVDCVEDQTLTVRIADTRFQSAEDVLTGDSWGLRVESGETVLTLTLAPGAGRVLRLGMGGPLLPTPTPISLPPESIVVEPVLSFLTWVRVEGMQISEERGIVTDEGSMLLFDLTDPLAPVIGPQTYNYLIYGGLFLGNTFYGEDLGAGPVIFDVSNIENAIEIGRYSGITGNAADLHLTGDDRLFVAAQNRGLRVFDVSDSTQPSLLAESEPMPQAFRLSVLEDRHVFVFGLYGGSKFFDVSSENQIALVQAYPDLSHVYDSHVFGEVIYAAAMDGGLVVIDVAASPPEIVRIIPTVEASGLAQKGSTLFLADGAGGVRVYRLSDPLNPRYLFTVRHDRVGTASAVGISGDYLFVGSMAGGIHVLPLKSILTSAMIQVR